MLTEAHATLREIIAEYEASLQGDHSPDYDHGTACVCYAAVQHGQFLRNSLAAMACGILPDETTVALMIDSATQIWAWHLHKLENVGNGPWAQ